MLDCDLVRHNPGGPAPWKATDEDVETAATWYQRAADRAAAYDVTLLIEIHARWLSETVSGTKRLLSAIDRDNVGVIHDAGNMFLVGEEYGVDSVDRLGDDLRHVHVKDEQRVVDADEFPGSFRLETADGLQTYRPRRLGEERSITRLCSRRWRRPNTTDSSLPSVAFPRTNPATTSPLQRTNSTNSRRSSTMPTDNSTTDARIETDRLAKRWSR
ncbi:sugar phosphate isomerase/epimerase family protein [Saliphagus sp. GCM10025308]